MAGEHWPTQFRIRSRFWTIEYVDRLPDEDADDPSDPANDLLGCCRADLRRIYISLDQSAECMKDTLVHELMHAVYATMPGVDEESEEAEENWVRSATEAFFEVVRNSDKPWWL